jgi:hypothetical protein
MQCLTRLSSISQISILLASSQKFQSISNFFFEMVWILKPLISTYSTSTSSIGLISTQLWMPRTMGYGFAYRPISRNLLRLISLSWVSQPDKTCWPTAFRMDTESTAAQSRICQPTWWKSSILSPTTMITEHLIRSTGWRQHTILSSASSKDENRSLHLRSDQSTNQRMAQSMPQSSVVQPINTRMPQSINQQRVSQQRVVQSISQHTPQLISTRTPQRFSPHMSQSINQHVSQPSCFHLA